MNHPMSDSAQQSINRGLSKALAGRDPAPAPARAFNVGTAGVGIDIEHIFGLGAYAKRVAIPAGAFIEKHVHDFDHISFLQQGTVVLERGADRIEFTGPCPVLVRAGVVHKVTALTPALWFCMHITDETDPDKIDEVLTS